MICSVVSARKQIWDNPFSTPFGSHTLSGIMAAVVQNLHLPSIQNISPCVELYQINTYETTL